jgi:hypothetical protein
MMSTHRRRTQEGTSGWPPISAPIRALGRVERRRIRRRQHTARGTATPSAKANSDSSVEETAFYWVGDERDTTHGDW